MNLQENIDRIRILMGHENNKQSLLREYTLDPKRIAKLITDFVDSTDNLAKTKIIRGLSPEERAFFNDYLQNFTNISKENLSIKSIDDLLSASKANELLDFSKSFSKNLDNLKTLLKNKGIDYSQYLNLQKFEVPLKTNDEILNDVANSLTENNVFKRLIDSMKNKKIDSINQNDIFLAWRHIEDRLPNIKDQKSKEILINLQNDLVRLNDQISTINNIDLNLKNLEVKQVAGIRMNSAEYTNLKKIVEEKGWNKSWGWDSVNDNPISVKATVNNVDVEFSVTDKGPRTLDFSQLKKDGIYQQENFNRSQSNLSWPKYIYELYKNDPVKLDLYFPHYKVLGGVKIPGALTLDGKTWLIVNPNLDNSKNFDFVLNHEITHVEQPSVKVSDKKQNYKGPNAFSDPNEALVFLTSETDYLKKTKNTELNWVKFSELDYAQDVIDEWSRLNGGKNPLDDRKLYENFMNWAKENDKIPSDLYDEGRIRYTTKNFSKETKKRSFDAILDEYLEKPNLNKEKYDKINRIKKMTQNFNENQLLTFLKNNSTDPDIKSIILKMADDLGYYLTRVEIEADYAALVREIIDLGTKEENEGFVTWMVDWLKKSNKLDSLQPEKKETFIEQIKNYIFGRTKNENYNNLKNPYYDKVSWYFSNFFDNVEKKYKKVYPEDAQKLYKGLYKQLYELISKGYPALLPFIIVGTNEFSEDNPSPENTNESKKPKLTLRKLFENLTQDKNYFVNYLFRRYSKNELDESFEKTKNWVTKNFKELPFDWFMRRFIVDMIDNLEKISSDQEKINYEQHYENLKQAIEQLYINKIKKLYLKLKR